MNSRARYGVLKCQLSANQRPSDPNNTRLGRGSALRPDRGPLGPRYLWSNGTSGLTSVLGPDPPQSRRPRPKCGKKPETTCAAPPTHLYSLHTYTNYTPFAERHSGRLDTPAAACIPCQGCETFLYQKHLCRFGNLSLMAGWKLYINCCLMLEEKLLSMEQLNVFELQICR